MKTQINFHRINNDVNGNPRYVCHFLAINNDYDEAVRLARKMGGKRFHNKQFGGGIVFQSYNLQDTERHINELKGVVKCHA